MTEFNDFVKGTKVLSARSSQPGIVTEVYHSLGYSDSGDWFDVEWERHPGTTRTYFRNEHCNDPEWGGLPTIVECFDWEKAEIETPQGVFVDTLANHRDALQAALENSLVPTAEGNVEIDINKFLVALNAHGFVYIPNSGEEAK